jgi:hypoxanthine-DNA glycosylase
MEYWTFMAATTLYSFPPIIGDEAHTLILGNMPSVNSLAAQQYYATPQNAFWRIMAALFDFDATAPYENRVARLRDRGIAVWDVLRSCRRVGSLDSAVEPDSMVANDFPRLFGAHPEIQRVFFNGAAAEKNFNRLVRVAPDLRYRRLPSTSPAQTMKFEEKLSAWRVVGAL